jgi:hypothetical protein
MRRMFVSDNDLRLHTFLKMSVQDTLKISDRIVIWRSYYPSEFAGLRGRFVARIAGDCAFRVIGLDG